MNKSLDDEPSATADASWTAAWSDALKQRKIQPSLIILIVGTSFISVWLTFFWTSGFTAVAVGASQLVYGVARPYQAFLSASSSVQSRERCFDPYRRPGYLSIDRGGDHRKTRWIPYATEFWAMPDPPSAIYPPDSTGVAGQIWFDEQSEPEPQVLDGPLVPRQWMAEVVEEGQRRHAALGEGQVATDASFFVGHRDDGDLGWLWGRVVLLVSDSIDRFMIQYFCYEIPDAIYQAYGQHTTASCFVPAFNLTFVHWHGVGMPTDKLEPFWDPGTSYVPWELRYQEIWSKTFPMLTGINGIGPDLILWQSSLWDREDFAQFGREGYGENSTMSSNHRQAVWAELRFYAARARKMLLFMRERFGNSVPLMLRATTIHRTDPQYDLMLYDIDRLARGLAEQFQMEVFEWGRIVSGQHNFYHDGLHLTHGPASWLWATMVLEYLARSSGVGQMRSSAGSIVPAERKTYFSGWQACNPELVDWGGR